MIFQTERLTGYLVSTDHAEALHNYYVDNSAHLKPWEPKRDSDYHSLSAWRERVENYIEEHNKGIAMRMVALSNHAQDLVGVCNFTNISGAPSQACYLGYSIAARYAGQGLMTEIVGAGIQHVFNQYDLHRVMANYVPENLASGRVLEKLGFEKEGMAKSYLQINGVWRDHVLTAKLNPDH